MDSRIFLFCLIALTACTGASCVGPTQFTASLSAPDSTGYDRRLLGTWYGYQSGEEPIKFSIEPEYAGESRESGNLKVRLFLSPANPLLMDAYRSRFDGRLYYTIKPDRESYKSVFEKAEKPAYYFTVIVEIEDDNSLILYGPNIPNEGLLTAYIAADKIRGASEVSCGTSGEGIATFICAYYLLEQSREELKATIREITPERFFSARLGPFYRQPGSTREMVATTVLFDENTGCAVNFQSDHSPDDKDMLTARIRWHGECDNGKAAGTGNLEFMISDELVFSFIGPLVNGQPHGKGRCWDEFRAGEGWHPCQFRYGVRAWEKE